MEFGLRAKKIKNKAKVNSERSREELVRMLKRCEQIIDVLKRRVDELEGNPELVEEIRQANAINNSKINNDETTTTTEGETKKETNQETNKITQKENVLRSPSSPSSPASSSSRELQLLEEMETMRTTLLTYKSELTANSTVHTQMKNEIQKLQNQIQNQMQKKQTEDKNMQEETTLLTIQMEEKITELQMKISDLLCVEKDQLRKMKKELKIQMNEYKSETNALSKAMLSVVDEIALEKQTHIEGKKKKDFK